MHHSYFVLYINPQKEEVMRRNLRKIWKRVRPLVFLFVTVTLPSSATAAKAIARSIE